MPTYRVTRIETMAVTYHVTANSLEEAKEHFDHGDWLNHVTEVAGEFISAASEVEDAWEEETPCQTP